MHAVVLTWNGAHLLPEALDALRRQDAPARLHLVVADNASSDGTRELLARSYPEVEHLRLSENLGYGRANNEAMRRALEAGADFVALINNDVEAAPDWLRKLLEAAGAHPEAGLFAGTLLFRGEEVVNSTGLEIDAFGRARDRDFRVPLSRLSREDGPVAGVSGGAALLRVSLLRQVGLFDPAYFAYYEDVDLSLRAVQAGSQSWYVRGAVARHRFRPPENHRAAPARAEGRGAGPADRALPRRGQGAAGAAPGPARAGLGRAARRCRGRRRGPARLQR